LPGKETNWGGKSKEIEYGGKNQGFLATTFLKNFKSGQTSGSRSAAPKKYIKY
jgi:hypothetical protein